MQALRSLSCDTAQRGEAGSVETQISHSCFTVGRADIFTVLEYPNEPIRQQSLLKPWSAGLSLRSPGDS